MLKTTLTLMFIVMCNVLFFNSSAAAQNVSTTFETLTPALALVSYREGDHIHFGTAFCIESTITGSYFLTNKHVVSNRKMVSLDLAGAPGRSFAGEVVAESRYVDAAIVRAPVGNIKTLKLAAGQPKVGQPIAIVGFPLFQMLYFFTSHKLVASLHSGMVNALLFEGAYIEYDASTDRGNSGGPIVDSSNGLVYGMATYVFPGASPGIQNNIALSVSDLAEMFEDAGLRADLAMGPGAEALKKAETFFSFAARSTGTVRRGRP